MQYKSTDAIWIVLNSTQVNDKKTSPLGLQWCNIKCIKQEIRTPKDKELVNTELNI